MSDMFSRLLLVPLLLLLCAAACRRPVRPPAKAAPHPAALRLSPENAVKVDRLYYRAVSAYSDNDMAAARAYLKEIFSIYPSYQPALELREKIRKVSGKN